MEEYRHIIVFFVLSAITWIIGCSRHYYGERTKPARERLSWPRRLRVLFGDVRQTGTLEIRGLILQSVCYVALIVSVFLFIGPGLSEENVVVLYILQFIVPVIIISIVMRKR